MVNKVTDMRHEVLAVQPEGARDKIKRLKQTGKTAVSYIAFIQRLQRNNAAMIKYEPPRYSVLVNRAVPADSGHTYAAVGDNCDLRMLDVDVAQPVSRSFPSMSLLDTFLQKLYLVTEWMVKIEDTQYLVIDSEFEKRMKVTQTRPLGRVDYHIQRDGLIECLPPVTPETAPQRQSTIHQRPDGQFVSITHTGVDVAPIVIDEDVAPTSIVDAYRPYDQQFRTWAHRKNRAADRLSQRDGIEENPGPGEVIVWTPLWEEQVKKNRLSLKDGVELNPGPEVPDQIIARLMRDYDAQTAQIMRSLMLQVIQDRLSLVQVRVSSHLDNWVPHRSD
jgi:hypothetical protein